MSSLELKVPPPLVLVLVAAGMWLAAHAMAPVQMPLVVRVALATLFALLGIAFSGSGVVAFRAANTTRNPLRPEAASSLVCTGAYQITRNPMYVGMLLALVAWAAAMASAVALLGPVLFFFYISRFQVLPEERALASVFGAKYLAYKERVRRWL